MLDSFHSDRYTHLRKMQAKEVASRPKCKREDGHFTYIYIYIHTHVCFDMGVTHMGLWHPASPSCN